MRTRNLGENSDEPDLKAPRIESIMADSGAIEAARLTADAPRGMAASKRPTRPASSERQWRPHAAILSGRGEAIVACDQQARRNEP